MFWYVTLAIWGIVYIAVFSLFCVVGGILFVVAFCLLSHLFCWFWGGRTNYFLFTVSLLSVFTTRWVLLLAGWQGLGDLVVGFLSVRTLFFPFFRACEVVTSLTFFVSSCLGFFGCISMAFASRYPGTSRVDYSRGLRCLTEITRM